ncbi:CDGSH iron-sulfur domain-containing protein [Streptomyces sp. FH025]|uniref:CDGSH iron-sulfur domain-containing protein n=1 Tax=Streptomyces sp. FH025 TaxID=2815937 RepID=UPI001A9F5286|nr:CDGSH iron-sulfur domain-containing protein [Streptomyces sp. FH025]MBO1413292.1 CDGSH iron-sulfur domain-containing protein [Streptomyces sp. FH025]
MSGRDERPVTRLRLTGSGPVLVDGPVEIVLPDGRSVRADRPVIALCTCRRSRHYPFCDTTHRTRNETADD